MTCCGFIPLFSSELGVAWDETSSTDLVVSRYSASKKAIEIHSISDSSKCGRKLLLLSYHHCNYK